MKSKFILAVGLMLAAGAALADSQFKVATDSSSGTYNKLFGEVISACNEDSIVAATGVTGGAPGNLDALVNNKAQAAFMHSDVFLANSMADPNMARYKTLVAGWPEQIHVLVLANSKSSKHGMTAFGKMQFTNLSDLK